MKLISTIYVTALLIVSAQTAYGADPAAATDSAAPTPSGAVVLDDLSFLDAAGDCDAEPSLAVALEGEEGSPVVGVCGACSSSNCQGATRGQICYLGSGQGWGNCNIYSGGFRCPTGGWECQCGSGPLP